MPKKSYVDKVMSKVGDLPAVPEIVAEVIALTEDPDMGLSAVAEAIERDPALTAKLLKVSNSPYYGMRQVVGSLKLAMVILGVREVRNIVLGISVLDVFKDERADSSLGRNHFWDHCFATGALTKRLSSHFDLGHQGEDFSAGLLHDVGKLVLWRELRREYDAVSKEAELRPAPLQDVEREAFGFDHAEAGAALAFHWNLPETLVDAIGYHHQRLDTLSQAADPKLAAVVYLANTALHDDWKNENPASLQSCTNDALWNMPENQSERSGPEERRTLLFDFIAETEGAELAEFF